MHLSRTLRLESTPTVKALLGLILLLGLVALGLLARTTELTAHDLHVDRLAQHLRFPLATQLFVALTGAASEAAGVAGLLVGTVVLVVRGRRWDAFRLVGMAGAAWMLALATKAVVDRPRPPASLWAFTPDASGSFPSGHDTTAWIVVLVAAMLFAGTGRARVWAVGAAIAFAVLVGTSRIYLGDHYPTDVLGSALAVGAAGLLVLALTETTWVRRVAVALLHDERAALPAQPA